MVAALKELSKPMLILLLVGAQLYNRGVRAEIMGLMIVVSLLSGQWDSLMGGGNMPSLTVGAVAAAFSGIIAFTMLPSPPPDVLAKVSGGGGMHPKIVISNKISGFIRKL
ncbi:hypothetical protein Hdeb2414_s0010g00348321 [Helianthus debilis subsp. tardiflorus]